jgi:hypothetical protein
LSLALSFYWYIVLPNDHLLCNEATCGRFVGTDDICFQTLKIMLPDPLHFLAATNPISRVYCVQKSTLQLLAYPFGTSIDFLDHIVMLNEFLHLQSQNAEFKPN